MNGFVDFIKTFGAGRIAAMVAVSALLVGFFGFIIFRVSSPHMVPLFTDLSMRDTGQITRELDRLGVAYEIKQEGTMIMASSADLPRIKMRLAEQGLPKGGGVGYEIFDKSEALGTTSFVQNINHLRALEGELARSIRELDRVHEARVHLVIPERQLFARDKQDPSASIVLKLRGSLENAQVKAIQHLVASAVPGMKPTSVSIVDESGRLLATGRGDDQSIMSGIMEEKSLAHEQRLRNEIEEIVSSVVGMGRARVQVSAELDWNRVTQTQDLFDPDSRVARSTQSREEKNQTSSAGAGQVSVGTQVPGAAAAGAQTTSPQDTGEKTEETVNYEISRTSRTEVLEAGRIKRVSVAVLVDGTYAREGENVNYTPRTQEELERIGSLVRSAIGFDEKRGDKVEIVNLRFAEPPKSLPAAPAPGLVESLLPGGITIDFIMRAAELFVVFVLGILVLLLGVRPLIRTALSGTAAGNFSAAPALAAPSGESISQAAPQAPRPQMPPPESATSKALEYAMASGSQHKDNVEKVGELVKGNPREAIAVVRGWMNERPAA